MTEKRFEHIDSHAGYAIDFAQRTIEFNYGPIRHCYSFDEAFTRAVGATLKIADTNGAGPEDYLYMAVYRRYLRLSQQLGIPVAGLRLNAPAPPAPACR